MTTIFGTYDIVDTLSARSDRDTNKCTLDGEFFVVKRFLDPDESDRIRIRARGEALREIQHAGLARFVSTEESDDAIGLVYEWVEGETVAALIERGERWTDPKVFEFLDQVCDALRVAHEKDPPVAHRDIKPQNVVWDGTRFVVIDFDAAREFFDQTGNVSVIGTTGYAAPEQYVGQARPASDQFGIAACALHMVSGRHPTDFPLDDNLKFDLDSLTVSSPLKSILERMLAPNPKDRFESLTASIEAIARGTAMAPWESELEPLEGLDSAISVRQVDGSIEYFIRGHRRWWVAVLAIVLFAMTVALFFVAAGLAGQVLIFAGFTGFLAFRDWQRRDTTLRFKEDGSWLMTTGKKQIEGETIPTVVEERGMIMLLTNFGAAQRSDLILRTPAKSHTLRAGLLPVEVDALRGSIAALEVSGSSPPTSDETALVIQTAGEVATRPYTSVLRRVSHLLVSASEWDLSPKKREKFFKKLSPRLLQQIEAEGFELVGFFRERLFRFFTVGRAIYRHPSRGIFLIVAPDGRYSLASLDTGGTLRWTWGSTQVFTPSAPRFLSLPTAGSFERDISNQKAWLAEHPAVDLVTMKDRIALNHYYYRELVPTRASAIIVGTFFVYFVLFPLSILLILI